MTNLDIVNYVDAANVLALALQADIKRGDTISKQTVLALNKYALAAIAVMGLQEMVNKDKRRQA